MDRKDSVNICSINLTTNAVTHYTPGDDRTSVREWNYTNVNFCNACHLSYIHSNPTNPSEIIISPWYYNHVTPFTTGGYGCVNPLHLIINNEEKTFTYFGDHYAIYLKGDHTSSNLVFLRYKKYIYFRDGYFIISGEGSREERTLKITEDSDLKVCENIGLFNITSRGLQCLSYEASNQCLTLYDASIDEEHLEAT